MEHQKAKMVAALGGPLIGCVLAGSPADALTLWTKGILPTAEISAQGRIVTDVLTIGCTAGQFLVINVDLEQGETVGHGRRVVRCDGSEGHVAVRVIASRGAFEPGPADSCATVVNRDRQFRFVEEETRCPTINLE